MSAYILIVLYRVLSNLDVSIILCYSAANYAICHVGPNWLFSFSFFLSENAVQTDKLAKYLSCSVLRLEMESKRAKVGFKFI